MLVIIDCSSRAIFGKVSEAYGIRKTIFPKIIITVRIFFLKGAPRNCAIYLMR